MSDTPRKSDASDLFRLLRDLRELTPKGWYRHYKGGRYFLHYLCLRESDLEPVVFYRNSHDVYPVSFTRPLKEWLEEVSPGVRRYEREG